MDPKNRCQSCGMPLTDGFYGTNQDNSQTTDYCKFCYQNGEYVQPNLTMDDMIIMSMQNMSSELGMDEQKAKELATNFIPTLKRWKI